MNKTLYHADRRSVCRRPCRLEPKTRAISLSNSGLPYPLLVRAGQPTFLDIGGIPLGLFSESRYEETSLQLQPGDVLVFYSDGVVEMRNDADEEFGLKRLADTVQASCDKTPEEIVKSVSAALAEYIGRVRPQDDRTMIVVKMGEIVKHHRSEATEKGLSLYPCLCGYSDASVLTPASTPAISSWIFPFDARTCLP